LFNCIYKDASTNVLYYFEVFLVFIRSLRFTNRGNSEAIQRGLDKHWRDRCSLYLMHSGKRI